MQTFDPSDSNHLDIAREAAVQAYMNCAWITQAVREALDDEEIEATETAYSFALKAVRQFVAS